MADQPTSPRSNTNNNARSSRFPDFTPSTGMRSPGDSATLDVSPGAIGQGIGGRDWIWGNAMGGFNSRANAVDSALQRDDAFPHGATFEPKPTTSTIRQDDGYSPWGNSSKPWSGDTTSPSSKVQPNNGVHRSPVSLRSFEPQHALGMDIPRNTSPFFPGSSAPSTSLSQSPNSKSLMDSNPFSSMSLQDRLMGRPENDDVSRRQPFGSPPGAGRFGTGTTQLTSVLSTPPENEDPFGNRGRMLNQPRLSGTGTRPTDLNDSDAQRSESMPPQRSNSTPPIYPGPNEDPFQKIGSIPKSHPPNVSGTQLSQPGHVGLGARSRYNMPGLDQPETELSNFRNLNLDEEASNASGSRPLSFQMPSPSLNQHTSASGYLDYVSRIPQTIPQGPNVWEESGIAQFPMAGGFTPDTFVKADYGQQFGGDPNARQYDPMGGSLSPTDRANGLSKSHGSPYYPMGGTPPLAVEGRMSMRGGGVNRGRGGVHGQFANHHYLLERKLRELQQQNLPPMSPQGMMMPTMIGRDGAFFQGLYQGPPHMYPFPFQHQSPRLPMSPHFPHSPLNPIMSPPSNSANRRVQDDYDQNLRSALLEEFRSNNKSNKKYELKDIYNHVTEFSGDQHGSRFIQQKLETANSDEKEIVYNEIRPNALQLMTDVFGNYVIQKFFEHGNQVQKSQLAKQMEGHIMTLSMQMYGCRVVQKALEHILVDQQAALVKELDGYVLKCVKDQNGNHVVQKAIERVPSEHIQFIIKAFSGQVHSLATHPYGCRVIQRMLEYCDEEAQASILGELHICTYALVQDQYGNYVTQHVLEQGKPEDRAKIISLVTSQLVHFSKHKFASNVVEKSIVYGNEQQRHEIVQTITSGAEGANALQLLMRDQYGNYVIQKLLGVLIGKDREELIDKIKPQIVQLKKFTYGKQINAIERLIYTNPSQIASPLASVPASPPPLIADAVSHQSPQSSGSSSIRSDAVNGTTALKETGTGDSSNGGIEIPSSKSNDL